jgi:hypothetical protein
LGFAKIRLRKLNQCLPQVRSRQIGLRGSQAFISVKPEKHFYVAALHLHSAACWIQHYSNCCCLRLHAEPQYLGLNVKKVLYPLHEKDQNAEKKLKDIIFAKSICKIEPFTCQQAEAYMPHKEDNQLALPALT